MPSEKSGPVSKTPVRGFFSQYVPRPGEQYYRDLAGNIKRVGFSLNFSPPEKKPLKILSVEVVCCIFRAPPSVVRRALLFLACTFIRLSSFVHTLT